MTVCLPSWYVASDSGQLNLLSSVGWEVIPAKEQWRCSAAGNVWHCTGHTSQTVMYPPMGLVAYVREVMTPPTLLCGLWHFFLRQGGYVIIVVCLSVCLLATLHENFRTDFQEIYNEQVIKLWWRSGSPSGCRDCFPDSSLLGDTESG